MSFFSDILGFIGGKSIASNLARVAILGFASRLLNKNTSSNDTATEELVDPGVRIQLDPSTDNKIPILYGEAFFGGYITDAVLASDYKKMTFCITLAESTGTLLSTSAASAYTFHDLYFDNNRIVFKSDGVTVDYTLDQEGNQDIKHRDLVKIYLYNGQTGIAPDGSGVSIPAPSTVMPNWTSGTHPMTGLLYAIVEVTYSRSAGVTGLPNCVFHLENSMTLPGDVLNDYMQSDRYGAEISAADIDTSLTSLNTFATTGFSYTDANSVVQTGTIEINGLVDTSTDVLSNMQALAEAGSAWMSYNVHDGKWSAIINQPGTSVASIDGDHIIGEISVGGTGLTQLHNAADVRFQNTDIRDKTDFAKINLPGSELFQNEVPNTLQLSLPFTNKQSVAIKLGAQALKQARVDKIISFTTDYSFINIRAGELIDVTDSTFGFTNKVFRVISVEEEEGDDATILIRFQCLEYDANVYSFSIQEVEIETDDGLLSVGAIGTPDVPVVQTIQESNLPRINVTADVPSGIVDSMEFWLTFDVGVSNDADRTYERIGAVSNPDGSLLEENDTVSFRYSQLQQSNFFIKVRGVNNLTSGPFSSPTGLIVFTPTVVADTVSDSPVAGIGGSLMTLGLLTLLNNVDDLLAVFNGEKSIKDALKDIFFGAGVDDPDDAATLLANDPDFLAAVGEAVSDIGTYSINALNDVNAPSPSAGNVLVWSGSAWIPINIDECLTCNLVDLIPGDPEPPEPPGQCYLSVTATYPGDRTTWANSAEADLSGGASNPDKAPTTGSYYIVYDDLTQGVYAPLTAGTGNVYLYKSDGTLVETLAAGALTITDRVVELPFADRQPKTDYYILMDEGVIEHCDCISPEITVGGWNFNTPPHKTTAYTAPVAGLDTYTWADLTLGLTPSVEICKPGAVLRLTFSEAVTAGSGSVTLKTSAGATVATYALGDATVDGNIYTWPIAGDLQFGGEYVWEVPAGLATTTRTDLVLCDATITAVQDSSPAATVEFSVTSQLQLLDYTLYKFNDTEDPGLIIQTKTLANPHSEIRLQFNRGVQVGDVDPAYVKIYKSNGSLHQQIDVHTNFANDQTNELINVSGEFVTINPTVDMEVGGSYYMTIEQGAFKDSCGSTNDAISNPNTITWTIYDGTQLISSTPANGSVGNINDTGISMIFDEEILGGFGQMKIYDGATLVAAIDSDDADAVYSDSGVTPAPQSSGYPDADLGIFI